MIHLLFVAAEIFALGFFNLVAFVPTFLILLFKRNQRIHKNVVSDIPGNPQAFDLSIISLFRTLPEPSNFNIVWTGLPYDEPLLVKGECPFAQCNSLSIYGQGSSDPPKSVDLAGIVSSRGLFEIEISRQKDGIKNAGTLDPGQWQRGFCAMRNYLVPPGTRIVTPTITRVRDGAVVRKPQILITGPATLHIQPSSLLKGIVTILPAHLLMYIFNIIALPSLDEKWKIFGIPICSLLVAVTLRWLCFLAGKQRLAKYCTEVNPIPNSFVHASLESGAKASQPSTLHEYWIMNYDVRGGQEISIRGKIDPALQRYWSIVPYDLYGLPLSQYVFDGNVVKELCTGQVPGSDSEGAADQSRQYEYDVRVTASPLNTQQGTSRNTFNPALGAMRFLSRPGITLLDVSRAPKGYILFRLVHPIDRRAVSLSAPSAEVVIESNKKAQ